MLRDYLTDLFPIMELGTSAKMLSIVPLIAGGGMFETGAGGSAPKHVEQLLKENYLRWDSLGEFLALAASFEHLAQTTGNAARPDPRRHAGPGHGTFLNENKSPSRRARRHRQPRQPLLPGAVLGEELAAQTDDAELAAAFAALAKTLAGHESDDRRRADRRPGLAGGHRRLLPARPGKAEAVMRPSKTFNEAMATLA